MNRDRHGDIQVVPTSFYRIGLMEIFFVSFIRSLLVLFSRSHTELGRETTLTYLRTFLAISRSKKSSGLLS
jgi:hypothetical protein